MIGNTLPTLPLPPPPPEKCQVDTRKTHDLICYAIMGICALICVTMIIAAVAQVSARSSANRRYTCTPAPSSRVIAVSEEPKILLPDVRVKTNPQYTSARNGFVDLKAASINSTIDGGYIRIDGEYTPVYTLSYEATFKYACTSNATVYISLPNGAIKDLVVKLNDVIITEVAISGKGITMYLSPGTNKIHLSYKALISNEYSHQVPTNKLVESFYARLEVRNIDWHGKPPPECLVPDAVSASDRNIIFIWNKENAILDKNIIIRLPQWENPFHIYLNSIPAFLILVLILEAFYYEAFRRIGKSWKVEHIVVLLVPFILLYLILGVSMFYVDPFYSAIISLSASIIAMYLIKRKVVSIPKGFAEIFLIPVFLLISVATLSFVKSMYSLVVSTAAFIIVVALGIKFFKTYERPKKKLSVEDICSRMNALEEERKRFEQELVSKSEDTQKLLARIREKRFC